MINVRQSSSEAYVYEWKDYIPSTVSIVSGSLNMSITGLKVESTSSHSIRFSWEESLCEDVIGYNIYRNNELIAHTDTPEYIDTNLNEDTEYSYSVEGYTEYSMLTDRATVDSSTTGVTGVSVYRSEWDVSQINDGTYTVIAEVTDRDGESFSTSGSFMVSNSIPDAIASFVAVGDTDKIVLSWAMSHEIDTTRYHIYRRISEADSYRLIKQINGRNILSYTDTNVDKGKKYYYYIVGVNYFGTEGDKSEITGCIPLTDTEEPRITRITPVNGKVISDTVNISVQAQDNCSVVKTELYMSMDDV